MIHKNNYRNRILFLSMMFACGLPSMGQQQTFTLDECIESALRNNVRIKNAENELKMAEQDKKEAFTKYFPNISAAGSGFIANEPLVDMQLSPEARMAMLKDGMIGGVSAALPLFTGGQIVNGNRLAKVGVEVKQIQKAMTHDEVILTTEKYFWQIVTLKEKIKTLSVVEKQLKRIYEDVKSAEEAGLVTRNDLLQVQLKQNETYSARIQVENALSVSKKLLGQYTGVPSDSLDVAFVISEELPERPDILLCNHEEAIGRTHEYQMLQQNVQASRLQYKMSIGKNLPTIAIGGGFVYDNFLMGQDQAFGVGFATLTVPLSGWWGGSHSIKKQKLQVRIAENQLEDNKELLAISIQNAWNGLNDAYKQIEVAHLSIEQSAENLRLSSDYYSAGTSTMSELLDAQTLYQQSRDKYVEAFTNYELKKREYLQATGR